MTALTNTTTRDHTDALTHRYTQHDGVSRAVVVALARDGSWSVCDIPQEGDDGEAFLVEHLGEGSELLGEASALARDYGLAKAAYHGALRDGEPCQDPLREAPRVSLQEVRRGRARARATASRLRASSASAGGAQDRACAAERR